MERQEKPVYDITMVRVPNGQHNVISVKGEKYRVLWDQMPEPLLSDVKRGQDVIIEGMAKIINCLNNDLRSPPAVNVTLFEGCEPQALAIWNYKF